MESVPIFPPPPGYSAAFSQSASTDATEVAETKEFQIQPPQPIEDEHVVFGETQETKTGLPKLTVKQLFDEENLDFKRELHRLHGEVLDAYGDLMDTVINQRERYARLTERIGVVIRNMIQLVNLLRPYQGLESVRLFMQKAIETRRHWLKETAECKETLLQLLNERLFKLSEFTSESL